MEEDGKGLGFECGKWEIGPRKDFKGPPRGLRGGGVSQGRVWEKDGQRGFQGGPGGWVWNGE